MMKFFKRGSTVLLLLLLLSAGFGVQAQDATISFLTPPWGVPPSEEALQAFTDASGIAVEIQSVQSADLFSRVQVAGATGQAPADVIFVTEEAPSNIVAIGHLMSLNAFLDSGELDLDDFEKMDFWAIDDEVFAVPTYLQLVMMDYNAKSLADAGFDAPPATWAELAEMAYAIRDAGIDDHPIAMGAISWSWFLIALSMGDPMFDAELNPVFADADSIGREAMALLLSFFEDELISPEILAGSINQHSLFWSGVGVFHQAWQGSLAVANNPERSQQAPDTAYMVLPEVGNTWSFPAGIGISTHSENPEAAWEFIKWYVGDENMTAIYNAFGLYPSRRSVSSALNDAGAIEGYDAIVEQSMHVNELPRYALWWGPFAAIVSETILEAAQSGMAADDVIDQLADEWNELKDEYAE